MLGELASFQACCASGRRSSAWEAVEFLRRKERDRACSDGGAAAARLLKRLPDAACVVARPSCGSLAPLSCPQSHCDS